MIRVAILTLLTISFPCWSNDKDRAIRHIQRAIIKHPKVKRSIRKVEKKVIKYLPVDKETFGVVGGTVVSIVRGGINTRVLKNIDFDLLGGNCRPDVEYKFDGTLNTAVNINWQF